MKSVAPRPVDLSSLQWLKRVSIASRTYTHTGYTNFQSDTGHLLRQLEIAHGGWRMPTIHELAALHRHCAGPKAGLYWATTPNSEDDPYSAMAFDFAQGKPVDTLRSVEAHVMLVRCRTAPDPSF